MKVLLMSQQDYEFYGCRLRSQLPLSLIPLCSTVKDSPDISLRYGSVPTALAETVWSSSFVSLAPDGTALVQVADGVRFLVRSGTEITVETPPGTEAQDAETVLMGAVAGIALHQRSAFPLHASSVIWHGVAVAFCGPCGRGKSTLARAMMQRGADLLSDDVSVIEFAETGPPRVMQGSCGIRLWPDTREMFGEADEAWVPIRSGHRKHVTTSHAKHEPVQPLGAIIRVAQSSESSPGIRRLSGPSAVMPLSSLVYRAHLGRILGRSEDFFEKAMKLALATPIFELRRTDSFDRLDEVIDWITDALEDVSCSKLASVG